jgi:membrane-associated phospholipid phosphatase
LPKPLVLASAGIAPVALAVAAPRSRSRDAALCGLQMWAYLAAYEMPFDDRERLRERVHVRYPIVIDRILGAGKIPTERLQGWFSQRGRFNSAERALVWCHWLWFFVPHGAVAYVLLRDRDRFGAAAARMYAVFDLGAVVYWTLPTAPPWWAAVHGELGGEPVPESVFGELDPDQKPVIRRMMLEYGQQFWGERWAGLYDVLGGNPLAAMPSLHFASSLMAAQLLSETGPVAGTIGWVYAGTLGTALVYLGEHYAVDLIAGAALAGTVQRGARRMRRPARALTGVIGVLRGLAAGS